MGWWGGRQGDELQKKLAFTQTKPGTRGAACDTATVIVLLSRGESFSLRGTRRMMDGRQEEVVMKLAAAWRADRARWKRHRPKRRDPSLEGDIQKIKK